MGRPDYDDSGYGEDVDHADGNGTSIGWVTEGETATDYLTHSDNDDLSQQLRETEKN